VKKERSLGNAQKERLVAKHFSSMITSLTVLMVIIGGIMIFASYYLGLFNLSCSMQSGFSCQNVALATNGNLTLSISTLYVSAVASSPTSNAIFYVAPQNTGFNPVGFPTTAYKCYPADVNLIPGQSINLVCQIPSLKGSPVGTPFTGTIWMNFSQSPEEPAVFTEKIGMIVTKSS